MSSGSVRMAPISSVLVVTTDGAREVDPSELSVELVGTKAFGLSCIPPSWSLPFFVVSGLTSLDDPKLALVLRDCLSSMNVEMDSLVMVRSSGTKETMLERGVLPSEISTASKIVETIRMLVAKAPKGDHGVLHWVIQRYVEGRASGQLSNERRVSSANRDWLLAVESNRGFAGATTRIAVRPWRDGRTISFDPLLTTSELGASVSLKRVAMWATQFTDRMHFEWLWDGTVVYLLQADLAISRNGVDPTEILDVVIPTVNCDSLQVFRPATDEDFARYNKLRKANLYRSLGYVMPHFYVLDNQEAIDYIVAGIVPPSVRQDLVVLTARPLIVRTDGIEIPEEKREMLPRSDELFGADQASSWLLGFFRETVLRDDLQNSELCLIAHHFIPSAASAWARAEPGRPIVRIEALWGLPEGLYWYAHDTYEVDTQTVDIPKDAKPGKLSYPFKSRLRYKGTFVGPNSKGEWVPEQPAQSFDWKRVVTRAQWLFEIALRTRQIAEQERQPVSVMWFIDNHKGATRHAVLPWFHSRSESSGIPKAAPRRKYRSSRDFQIRTEQDWLKLREELEQDAHIERVIVEPTDPTLIRNADFARELGALANAKRFVVELSGGILSHAYYLLQKSGARVECVDLFGSEEDVTEFNKVVRDKIADIIVERGERADTVRLTGDALLRALKQKVVEESYEALDAQSGEELIGELADVLEVIHGICGALGIPFARIDEDRREKRKRRGGFDDGLMLRATSTPQSLHPIRLGDPSEASSASSRKVISELVELPQKAVYRHQDLRKPEEQEIEKQLTVEAELNHLSFHRETFNFAFGSRGEDQSLALELSRDGANLRIVIRLRRGAVQLRFDLPDQK